MVANGAAYRLPHRNWRVVTLNAPIGNLSFCAHIVLKAVDKCAEILRGGIVLQGMGNCVCQPPGRADLTCENVRRCRSALHAGKKGKQHCIRTDCIYPLHVENRGRIQHNNQLGKIPAYAGQQRLFRLGEIVVPFFCAPVCPLPGHAGEYNNGRCIVPGQGGQLLLGKGKLGNCPLQRKRVSLPPQSLLPVERLTVFAVAPDEPRIQNYLALAQRRGQRNAVVAGHCAAAAAAGEKIDLCHTKQGNMFSRSQGKGLSFVFQQYHPLLGSAPGDLDALALFGGILGKGLRIGLQGLTHKNLLSKELPGSAPGS